STNAGASSPAHATSRNFRNRLQNRPAAPVTRRQSPGLPAKGDARVEITTRAARAGRKAPAPRVIKEQLRLCRCPGDAMLPLAAATLFEAITAPPTAPGGGWPAAPPCLMRAQYPAAVTRRLRMRDGFRRPGCRVASRPRARL